MWVFWLGNKIQDFKVKYLGKEIRVPSSKASKGERAVSAALDRLGYDYTMQYPFWYMHVDFCVKANDKLYFINMMGSSISDLCPTLVEEKLSFSSALEI